MERLSQYACTTIRNFSNSGWGYSAYWLFFTVVGLAVPVITSFIIIFGLKREVSIALFTHRGQFAIYGISMLVNTAYLIFRPHSGDRYLPHAPVLGILVTMLLSLLLSLFVLAILLDSGLEVDTWILTWPTIALFGVTCVVAYSARVADSQREADYLRKEEESKKFPSERQEAVEEISRRLG